MKQITSLLLLIILCLSFSNCAVVTALRQPSKKNLQVLTHGASRDNVISIIGAPVTSEMRGEERIEIYNFVQGYSGGVKASRALFHLAADLFTLFIWEIIGWPAEAVLDGHEVSVKVLYDKNDTIKDVVYLLGEK